MKINIIGEPKVIMSNPTGKHNYFGWPTAVRLQNGKIAVVASGYRLSHICPFGKTVISYSEDDGNSYTVPAPVIDTVLDDRDGGIMTFGEKGVVVTSFNNTVDFQRVQRRPDGDIQLPYRNAYLDMVTNEEENEALGATFRISCDFGVTFGEIHKSPITSPHGPLELQDGSILWVGRTFSGRDAKMDDDKIKAYSLNPSDGSMEYVGEIENVTMGGIKPLSCEPHTAQLADGTLLCHIRVQNYSPEKKVFTVFQSESHDFGETWTKPVQLLEDMGGAPPHLFIHSSGTLVCTYGYRLEPFGIKAMFSKDCGKSWNTGYDLYVNGVLEDIGYPSTVELKDGSMLTVFYAHRTKNEPAIIMGQKWRFEE